jgi:hypothetical protein
MRLVWTPHAVSGEVSAWHVYRRETGKDKGWAEVGATTAAVHELRLKLDELGDLRERQFAVTAEDWSGLESDVTSPLLSVSLRDVFFVGEAGPGVRDFDRPAPAPVQGFTAVKDPVGYKLSWLPSLERKVRYYNLYCSSTGRPEPVQAHRFASPPRGTTEYLDWAAPPAGPVFYGLTAVDRQGNESAPVYFQARAG